MISLQTNASVNLIAYLPLTTEIVHLSLTTEMTFQVEKNTYSLITTVIIAKVREVRENIKRNRLIWRIIQLWYFHHYYIVINRLASL